MNQLAPLSIDEWDRQMSIYALSKESPALTSDGKSLSVSSTDSIITPSTAQSTVGGVTDNTNVQAATGQMSSNMLQKAVPVYADEIPPFDITISFGNEYGQMSRIVIYGVEILNEGTGFSIDNVTSEKACTFVARRVDTMRAVTKDGSITNSRYAK